MAGQNHHIWQNLAAPLFMVLPAMDSVFAPHDSVLPRFCLSRFGCGFAALRLIAVSAAFALNLMACLWAGYVQTFAYGYHFSAHRGRQERSLPIGEEGRIGGPGHSNLTWEAKGGFVRLPAERSTLARGNPGRSSALR